jgi:TetR/AcrR family transcriptional regulator, regulator of autoinduction and epiphytic fitness
MAASPVNAKPFDEERRRCLLEAAIGVFFRFGFRKTSMDEVARAARISRQGLYLHFSTKEELFRAAVQHSLDTALAGATAALGDAAVPLEKRLVGAFDAWVGPFVGLPTANIPELMAVTSDLVGPLVLEREGRFVEGVAAALRGSGLSWAYKPAGLAARQLADTLCATARGLKHSATRTAFVEAMAVAVRAMCLPLRDEAPR